MPLTLSLSRGPLSDEALDAITVTYGTVDRRYADREFCRLVFNGNPFGYSYHAFVRDGDRVVGHYSVIPIRIRARGREVISGKGEALFLAEPHRASTVVAMPSGEVPAGIALMNALHEHVLAQGVAVLHNFTSPEIGMIHRMHGFRALQAQLDQLHFLIRPAELKQLRGTRSRAVAAQLLSAAQRALLGVTRTALRLTAPRAVEVNPGAYAERQLAEFAAAASGDDGTWAISRDLETTAWLKRLGRLEIVSIAGRPDQFAVMSKGNARELLLWKVPPGARRSGLMILCELLLGSVRDRAWIVSVTRRRLVEGGPSLEFPVRMLGFFPRRIPVAVYAKSADDFFLQSKNLDFTRMFHL